MDGACDAPGIQVIGAGMGRTGTKSLQAALDKLGYKTYHFPLPAHAETWAQYAEGRVSSDAVLDMVTHDGFTATCDNPPADLFREQLAKYPKAKVVLTVRDGSAKWASSWKVLMEFIALQEQPFSLSYPTFIQWVPFMRAWKRMRGCVSEPRTVQHSPRFSSPRCCCARRCFARYCCARRCRMLLLRTPLLRTPLLRALLSHAALALTRW